jgi:SAM-dependent methyltransferase
MNDASKDGLHLQAIQDYYGRVLQSSADLQTSACCLAEALPAPIAAVLREVHPEVKDRFYGCGSPIPPALDGATVLDLGCGSGRDCYVLSKLVGPRGRVIGVDMTAAQLAVARRHQAWHAERFGWANTEFHEGYIERLDFLADASVDLVVSNCVLNLSPDKPRVFREIFRVLKDGGELYFADVFTDRRVPAPLAADPLLLGECLGGALYVEDFRRLLAAAGCADARLVASAPLALKNPEFEARLGNIRFRSNTVRAFKLALEDRCEDYGQVAVYRGSIAALPHAFELDDHHRFEAGRPLAVCGNTADMLAQTRYAPHFQIHGDKTRHFGLFDCGAPAAAPTASTGACC